jgi:hypothetical protein
LGPDRYSEDSDTQYETNSTQTKDKGTRPYTMSSELCAEWDTERRNHGVKIVTINT